MNYSHPSFHTLKVGPDTAKRIDSEKICHQGDQSKGCHTDRKSSPLWTIFCIHEAKHDPTSKSYLHKYPKEKGFTCYEWKEKRIGDDKRK